MNLKSLYKIGYDLFYVSYRFIYRHQCLLFQIDIYSVHIQLCCGTLTALYQAIQPTLRKKPLIHILMTAVK